MCHKFIQLQNRLILFTCLLCRNMVGALFASITSFKLGRITDADSVTRAGETSAVFLHSRLCNMLLWNLVALELCMQQGTSERKAVCLTTIATDESQHPNGLFDPKQNWLVWYFTRIFSGHFQASCALEVDQPTEVMKSWRSILCAFPNNRSRKGLWFAEGRLWSLLFHVGLLGCNVLQVLF